MSVFAPALGYIWQSAEKYGLNARELFEEAGIDPNLRLDITARVNERQMDDLFWIARQKSRDEAFVFNLAKNLQPSYLGALGLAWLTSASLRKGFERVERYSRLVTDNVEVHLQEQGDEFHVIFQSGRIAYRDPAMRERVRLVVPVKLCRMTYGDSFCPSRIHFQHSEPANVHAYYEYFRCELTFDADVTDLVIPVSVADEPLSGFNPQIVQQMDQLIIDYLAKLDKSDVLGGTRAAILELLPSGEVSLESVAATLNMSARTLTRKLNDEGESFKNLLAKTRQELSEKYILDKSLTLTEISFLLGFSETSSFSRAYKSWTGRSPSSHRNNIFEGAAS